MVAELEPEEPNKPKKETATHKVFSSADIRRSIKLQRERIAYMMEVIEQADELVMAKRKAAKRKAAIADVLSADDKNNG